MTAENLLASLWVITLWLVHIGFMARAVLRRHREPASRLAWVVVIAVLPLFGIIAYLLLGETNIGRRRVAKMRQVLARLPVPRNRVGCIASSKVLRHFKDDRYAPISPYPLHPDVGDQC